MNMNRSSIFLLLLTFFTSRVARTSATYSIVSTDASARQVGGAAATCILGADIYASDLYLSVPNSTVIHRQGILLPYNDDPIVQRALDKIQYHQSLPVHAKNGTSECLQDVLDGMLDVDKFQINANAGFINSPVPIPMNTSHLRQYAMADFDSHLGYTGNKLSEFVQIYNAEQNVEASEETDVGGTLGTYQFHAAGNVVKVGTVESLKNGFIQTNANDDYGSCDMAGRLMAAMQSVADGGYGDLRCRNDDEKGYSATGAYLHIDNPDGTELIHINVIGDGTDEPVEFMRKEFMEWRKDHPCDNGDTVSSESTRWVHFSYSLAFLSTASVLFLSIQIL